MNTDTDLNIYLDINVDVSEPNEHIVRTMKEEIINSPRSLSPSSERHFEMRYHSVDKYFSKHITNTFRPAIEIIKHLDYHRGH